MLVFYPFKNMDVFGILHPGDILEKVIIFGPELRLTNGYLGVTIYQMFIFVFSCDSAHGNCKDT